ncbi:hypothetical protein EPJ67_09360 [Brachyspira aalborgi]|uniref:ATPase AAA-type core domain-containing protein n=1 Tax=Brachyspira aalborgi TaxID=29522 RepID=A0A5C8G1S4_9SPIR|nr:AAA family ATPase [Brachyspira aalborgi]TXJ55765.1 hypothetical protein EPJ67_09360 [Brachyspira aalborgi]
MNRRFLKIKNFKNIGIDKYQYLNLNNTLDPYKMGELVIIIGENNVGKSNILEAIERINSNNLEKDIPDFIGFDKSLPEISLVCVENEYKNEATHKREGNYNTLKIYLDDAGFTKTSIEFANSNENIINNANNDNKEKEDNKVIDENETKEITNNDSEEVDIIKEKYGINIKPNIFYYKENIIKNYDLTTTLENISESKFFKALLKSIDFNIDTIKLAYEKGKKNFAYREDYEKEINSKLNDIVSKKFNELYFNLNKSIQKYEFYIRLGDNNIHIYLKKNNQAINLDNQSIGFKWFFNLFFDFLHSDLLKRGDIVLMDELDAHLSLPARRDLRKFLKKFARDNGITFMVATHNPSFIDINHLDEIRIVKHRKEGNGVEIINDFHTINPDDVDTLEDIINSFGILHRDILTNPNNRVVFVEGITDYNYLTAFKLLRENEENKEINMVFLPISGIGNKETMKTIIEKLSKFRNSIVFTDADKAGLIFQELSSGKKDSLKVVNLKDIPDLNNKKEIEDLFSENDRKNYYYVIEKKNTKGSSLFKNTILNNKSKLEEETINNFNKVLDFFITFNADKNPNIHIDYNSSIDKIDKI